MALDSKVQIHIEYDGKGIPREQRFSNGADLNPRVDQRETLLTKSTVLFFTGAEEVYCVDGENGDRFTYKKVKDIVGSMGSAHDPLSYCRDLIYLLNERQH